VTVTGNQITVKLTNAANGTVVADAIRIERIISSNDTLLQTVTPHEATNWLTTLTASQNEVAPDALPLPTTTQGPVSAPPQAVASNAPLVTIGTGLSNLEDSLLADVVDLLASEQHALTGQHPTDLHSIYGLALGSLLGQSV
jgi:hypothetical protein